MEMTGLRIEQKLLALEESLARRNSKMRVAITEGHLSLAPHNSNPSSRMAHGSLSRPRDESLPASRSARKDCHTADFNGNRWTTNAVIHQVPGGVSYLLPRVPWRDYSRDTMGRRA